MSGIMSTGNIHHCWDCLNKHDIQRPSGKKPFENIVGKGENAGLQYFLLFP